MSNAVARSIYRELVDGISRLYEDARRSQVRFAWETGRRIVEVEQRGEVRAAYGSRLIEQLSKDLMRRHGSGFSATNLRDMRRFYLANKIQRRAVELPWTSQLALSRIEDPRKRRALEERAMRGGILRDDLRELVKRAVGANHKPLRPLPPLVRPTDLRFNTFRLAKPEVATLRKAPRGMVLVDCGFFSYRPVLKDSVEGLLTETPSYTYSALVERVIDGDTLVVLIDTGFENTLEEKLRLRGINTPELGTPEGEKAKKFVERVLPAGSPIVIRSQKSTDPHGRFVADVFYKAGCNDPEKIIVEGEYLNQVLIDKGYAVRMAG